jgi:hypothetical protein
MKKMKKIEKTVCVNFEHKNGKSSFNIKLDPSDTSTTLSEIRMILTGAVALTIKLSENQPEAMRKVIDFLQEDFVDGNSFEDGKLLVPEF